VRLSGVAPTPAEAFDVGIGGAGRGGEITVSLDVPAGSSGRFGFVQAVSTSAEAAASVFERVVVDVPAAVRAAETFWNQQLAAVFAPGNSEFSGHLPVLETSSDALRRLYGEIDNLLECVSSYTHEVASLNAANVWAMRVAADAADLSGDADGAQTLCSLVALGALHVAANWIEGLARSANQGPPGQGHFAEEAQPR
jgi:hypothetical protein